MHACELTFRVVIGPGQVRFWSSAGPVYSSNESLGARVFAHVEDGLTGLDWPIAVVACLVVI